MQSLAKTRAEPGLEFINIPEPVIQNESQVIVEVKSAGICGSDLHIEAWTPQYDFMKNRLPVVLGHEFSGVVHKTGHSKNGFNGGERVVVYPVIFCGSCQQCKSGFESRCLNRNALGVTLNGGFSRLVLVPAKNCIKIPDNIPFDIAALVEPLSIGYRAVKTANLKKNAKVIIFGPGTIGQSILINCLWQGITDICVVGFRDNTRLQRCLELGASHIIDASETSNLTGLAKEISNDALFDFAFEATGKAITISDALACLGKEGILTCTGIHDIPATVDITHLVRNRLQIRGAHSSNRKNWDDVIELIASDPKKVTPMISSVVSLNDSLTAFSELKSRTSTKIIIHPE